MATASHNDDVIRRVDDLECSGYTWMMPSALFRGRDGRRRHSEPSRFLHASWGDLIKRLTRRTESARLWTLWSARDSEVTDVKLTPPPTGGWALQASVVGGEPPYKLVVRNPEGAPESSARLFRPTTLKLMVRGGLDEVQIEVTDGTGKVVTTSVSQDEARATLILGPVEKKK